MNQQQKQYKILLIGDDCEDIYQYVDVDRLSPEAPVPVCKTVESYIVPGMASNVKNNLENLGCDVETYLGDPSFKTRIIDRRSNQHIIRLDDDVDSTPFDPENIDYSQYDAVVISDYNKGFLTYDNITEIIAYCRTHQIPVFLDTKKTDLQKFNGSYVKINQLEYNNAKTHCDNLIVTRGANSIEYNGIEYKVPKTEVVDVCGCGDTFLAALAVKFLETGEIGEGIKYAIIASSVTVQKSGVYAPTRKEIDGVRINYWSNCSFNFSGSNHRR